MNADHDIRQKLLERIIVLCVFTIIGNFQPSRRYSLVSFNYSDRINRLTLVSISFCEILKIRTPSFRNKTIHSWKSKIEFETLRLHM